VRRAQLEDHLLLRAELEPLLVLARAQVPDVQRVAVAAGQQRLGVEPLRDHAGRTPLARDHRVEAEVPPEVVVQVLRRRVDATYASCSGGACIAIVGDG
jgi:hypothetical protein